MKITKSKLMRIIKEEYSRLEKESGRKRLTEGFGDYSAMVDKLKKNLKENDIDLWSDDEPAGQYPEGGHQPNGDGVREYRDAARGAASDAIRAGATREQMNEFLKAVEAAIEYSFAGKGL
jgi:hypothetical protein